MAWWRCRSYSVKRCWWSGDCTSMNVLTLSSGMKVLTLSSGADGREIVPVWRFLLCRVVLMVWRLYQYEGSYSVKWCWWSVDCTSMKVLTLSSGADGLEERDVMLARRRFDMWVALYGVGAGSGYSVAIILGGRRPASAISSWNSDSSGNVSLHHMIKHVRCYASMVSAITTCPSIRPSVRHKSVFYQNG